MTRFPLMLFAAGLGTRMRPLTEDRPKPMIPVAGRPLLDHALALARSADCGPIVVNTHYRAAQIERHLAGQSVQISHEPVLLETGGGLRAALPLLGPGAVMILNCDVIWTGLNPLAQLAASWDPSRMDGLLLTLPAAQATGHLGSGDFLTDSAGHLGRAHGQPGDVYLGAQILKTDALADVAQPIFSLNLLWDRMILGQRLFGLRHKGGWCDVGHPGSIPLAEALLRGSQ